MCQLCKITCKTCSDQYYCDSCDTSQNRILSHTGFYSRSFCICADGYFESLPKNPTSSSCQKCHPSCKDCENGTENGCILCNGDHRSLQNGTCVCRSGYDSQKDSVDCILKQCDKSCLTCSQSNSDISCSTCDTSNTINGNKILKIANGESRCVCQTGYYLDQKSGNCQKCSYSCFECTDSLSCSSCFSDVKYQRTFVGNQCICKDGFFDDQTNNIQCQKCSPTCKTCNTLNECNTCPDNSEIDPISKFCKCLNGFYNNDLSGKCICQQGYEEKKDGSFDCIPIICDSTCLTCSSSNDPNSCLSCREDDSVMGNWIKVFNQCQCKVGYYYDQKSGLCLKCHFSCSECAGGGPDQCTKCIENSMRQLNKNTCVCNNGYFQEGSNPTCQKCSTECATCVDQNNKCLSCISDQIFDQQKNTCKCKLSQYRDVSTGTCLDCHPTCKSCFGGQQNQCQSCFDSQNRILNKSSCICSAPRFQEPQNQTATVGDDNYVCQKVNLCDSLCQVCDDNNPKICIQCKKTLVLNTNNHLCGCNSGYTLGEQNSGQSEFEQDSIKSQQCIQCPNNCNECKYNSDTKSILCLSCQPNYSLEWENICQLRAPSRVSNDTIRMIYNTTETSTKVAISTTTSASLLLSIATPNGNLVQQFLSLQKLQFLLLINIAYPEFLYQFFKALGGTNIIEVLQKINVINNFFIKEPKHSNLLDAKFELETIPTSIFYNLGGALTIIAIAWIVFIPAQLIYRKNKLIQSKLEIYSPFAIHFKKIYEKVICAFFIQSHEILSLVISFSIMVSITTLIMYKSDCNNWLPRLMFTIVISVYFISLIVKVFKLVNSTETMLLMQRRRYQEVKSRNSLNHQDILKFAREIKSREVIYSYFIQDLIDVDKYSRNFKFLFKFIEDITIPLSIVSFQNNFIAQTSLCLSVQLILTFISMRKRPFSSRLNNASLILDQLCWVVVFACLLILGLKVDKLLEKGAHANSDNSTIEEIDIISWIIMYTCLVILFFSPLISIIKIILNLPLILNKIIIALKSMKQGKNKQVQSKESEQIYLESNNLISQRVVTLSEAKQKGYFLFKNNTSQNQQQSFDLSHSSTFVEKDSLIIPLNNLKPSTILKTFKSKPNDNPKHVSFFQKQLSRDNQNISIMNTSKDNSN